MPDDRPDRDKIADLTDQLTAADAVIKQLVEILIGKGVLAEGHRTLLAKTAERANRVPRPRLHLRAFSGDKYEITGPDIDCASLLHLCRARCCQFEPYLTRQDLDEGDLEWEIERPYIIRKASDGYCQYLGQGGDCGCYDKRPAACREFDCREDPRIWQDFENKVPAPAGISREYPAPPQ